MSGQAVQFERPDKHMAPGYFSGPQNGPGIVVLEEWWGVTPEIKGVADDYASLGYRALVPDLFRGRTAAVGDEATHLMEGLDFNDAASADIPGAIAYLRNSGSDKVGLTGYCMGGALSVMAAMHAPGLDAVACFYGVPAEEAGDPAAIKIPFQGHFAEHDAFFEPDHVRWLEGRLKAGNVPYELFWYDANHAFCNPAEVGKSGLGHYDPQAAKLAWQRVTEFFERTLR
ncbi:MAG: dienelactone hydrolase family protein [Candidatus Eremiobacteraeota bacterium]|nr:dienelactone hydrolase family protein [Candidatus Eremiobacteraeota bacterium]